MKTVFLNIHYSNISGSMDYFRDFLLRNNYNVISVYNPLDNYDNNETVIYNNIDVVRRYKRRNLYIINFFIDFFVSLKYINRYDFSTFIGANNFDTFVGIFAKKVLKKNIDKIIYFASDFSENRFSNNILNKIYYFVEKIAVKNSDLVVSNTKRSELKRIEFGLDKNKSLVIPNGVLLNKEIFDSKDINKHKFVYVGSINKEHGLYDILFSISSIIDEIYIIGVGDDLNRVERILKEKNINYYLLGRKDHEFVINFLQNFNGFGLAPYNSAQNWTYYCSPLKVIEYISCGVPVIMSDIPEISEFILENDLGIVYSELTKQNLLEDIERFNVSGYNKKAQWFYNIYNQNKLFSEIKI
ncbi:MAG TPA: glycosyltransferase [bacterium]|nr:glycosyltransferase [bacterium]